MCGIIGLVGTAHVNHLILDGLSLLQHRGQDAAGIATLHKDKFYLHKEVGTINDIFTTKKLSELLGKTGIGHVRYPTAGSPGVSESQPFYVNSPHGIMFAHNGNITNAQELSALLHSLERRHLNTTSDSELLLNVFACGLNSFKDDEPTPEAVFCAIEFVNKNASGAFACVGIISGLGLFAFRDPNGIRPLVLGKRETENGTEYMVASESVALDITGFKLMRDVRPGEAIVIDEAGKIHTKICTKNSKLAPCLFEFVYFARPDSMIDNVSVYQCRVNAGRFLGNKILQKWSEKKRSKIDVVIPVPETGRVAAQEIASILNVDYREGFVKNRYVGRTFIMPTAEGRNNSVRRKLNPIPTEFKDKNVLLVDDSIVRGTTSKKIIEMVRGLGAKNVYFASASPPVKHPNVYGINMPTTAELVANGRQLKDIIKLIGMDDLIYLDLDDLKKSVQKINPKIKHFEDSVFSGVYITGSIDKQYLKNLEETRKKATQDEKKHLVFLADNLITNFKKY